MKSRTTNLGRIAVKTPLALPGMRIGVMGGSFNPPHAGHVMVAKTALRRLGLDQLWWLVTPGNPLKSHDGLAPLNERLADARALANDSRMVMTAFEDTLQSPYTAETLAFLKTRYRATRFVWVMGADNLAGFHRWQRWRDIAQAMPFAVVDRPGWHLRALSSPAGQKLNPWRLPEARARELPMANAPAWVFLTTRLCPVSSTDLRARRGGV